MTHCSVIIPISWRVIFLFEMVRVASSEKIVFPHCGTTRWAECYSQYAHSPHCWVVSAAWLWVARMTRGDKAVDMRACVWSQRSLLWLERAFVYGLLLSCLWITVLWVVTAICYSTLNKHSWLPWWGNYESWFATNNAFVAVFPHLPFLQSKHIIFLRSHSADFSPNNFVLSPKVFIAGALLFILLILLS